jgi:hypothetical protein
VDAFYAAAQYPSLKSRAGNCCPYPSRTLAGQCHRMPEKDYSNNELQLAITIPA